MQGAAAPSLSALRDIHLPAPVGAWPPAPGWWLLAGCLLLVGACIWLVVRIRRRRERAWQEDAARELVRIEESFAEQRDVVALATALSALLRRSVLARFPEDRAAALRGEDWFAFVCRESADELAPAPDADSLRLVRQLTHTAYAGSDDTSVEPDAWIAFVRSWIGAAA